MAWWGKTDRAVRHSVGRVARDASAGAFQTLLLPAGGVLRLMDRYVHMAALESAGRKLVELRRKSGQREPRP